MEVRPSLRASSPPEGRLAFNNFGCVPWCCLSRIVYRGIKQYKGVACPSTRCTTCDATQYLNAGPLTPRHNDTIR
jgi:hypothetical protein